MIGLAGSAIAVGGYLATHALDSGLNFLMAQRGEKGLQKIFDENTNEGQRNISRYIQSNLRGQAGLDQRGSYADKNRMAQLISSVPIPIQKSFMNYVNSNYLGGKENFDFLSGRVSFMNEMQKDNNSMNTSGFVQNSQSQTSPTQAQVNTLQPQPQGGTLTPQQVEYQQIMNSGNQEKINTYLMEQGHGNLHGEIDI